MPTAFNAGTRQSYMRGRGAAALPFRVSDPFLEHSPHPCMEAPEALAPASEEA